MIETGGDLVSQYNRCMPLNKQMYLDPHAHVMLICKNN